jgi:transposase
MVRAILAGERDPQTLAVLSRPGIHATQDMIAKSPEGTWQPDLLFVLQQEVAMYDAYQQRIFEVPEHFDGFPLPEEESLGPSSGHTTWFFTRS